MKFQGFIGEAYKMSSLPISAQRCVNWYPEKQTNEDSASLYVLQPTPGYKEIIDINDGSLPQGSFNRGIYKTSKGIGIGSNIEINGSIITVVGDGVFWLKTDINSPSGYTAQRLGSISNLMSRVSMVDDGFGVIIADGRHLYRIELSTGLFTQLNFELTNPSDVAFMGGYTIAIGTQDGLPQNTFFWSGLYGNDEWDALNYASAEQSQDPLTAMIVSGTYLYLFGPNSYELWTSTGDADMPFQRSYGSSGTIGIVAPKSLTKLGNSVFLIGSNNQGSPSAYMSNGTELVKVSTLALDQEWSKFNISDCTSWTRSSNGHDFVIFNFDAMNKTYVYDINQNTWHESASRDPLTDTLHRWEPNFGIDISSTTQVLGSSSSSVSLVGDRFSTKLFHLSDKYTTENGNNIIRIRTTAHQHAEQKPMRIDAVRFDMESGNGITNEDPFRDIVNITDTVSPDGVVVSNSMRNIYHQGMEVTFTGSLPAGLDPDDTYTIGYIDTVDDVLVAHIIDSLGNPISVPTTTTHDLYINSSVNRYTEAPMVLFRYSQDKGRTWSNELRIPFGRTGDYQSTVEFTRLGVARNFTVEFKISDPCHTSILNGFIYPVIAERTRRG